MCAPTGALTGIRALSSLTAQLCDLLQAEKTLAVYKLHRISINIKAHNNYKENLHHT